MTSHARRTDPETSHRAAARLKTLRGEQERILRLFHEYDSLTDSELEAIAVTRRFPMAGKSYYRRRRSDLKNMGLIRPTSLRRSNANGNNETVWELNPHDTTEQKGTHMATSDALSFDDGNIIFINDGGQWRIQGMNLNPGETVTVTTKSGDQRDVMVDAIIEEAKGIQIADFHYIDTIQTSLAEGRILWHQSDQGVWMIQGYGLIEGEQVEVTSRDGSTTTVTVEAITSSGDDGLQIASITREAPPPSALLADGRIIFTREGEEFMIRGRNLKPGATVKVTKKDGRKTKVKVAAIIDDTDGIQTATFTDGR